MDNTHSQTAGSPLEDVAYLTRSEHRIPALVALAVRPRSRSELWELTGVSSSTIRRTIREFERRNWIQRNGYRYEATQLGAYVAATMEELIERIETERSLRGVWNHLPEEESGFTIEMCLDAVLTVAEPDDPYRPVNRFVSLLEATNEFRFVGSDIALLEPCKDVLRERILDGMDTEIIDPPNVARFVLSTYPGHCSAPLESDHLTVLVHEELPRYGIGILDDRVVVCCYDQDTGMVRVMLDIDSSESREWAESAYASFRREARPLVTEPIAE